MRSKQEINAMIDAIMVKYDADDRDAILTVSALAWVLQK